MAPDPRTQTPKPTILLIEDEPAYRAMIAAAIGDQFQVEEASTIAEGLARMARHQHYDLVLLDLTLPDSARENTLRTVLEEHPEHPPVIVTGYDDTAFVQRMYVLGARDYLIKGRDDVDAVKLRSRMNTLLLHAQAMRKLGEAKEIVTDTRHTLETEFVERGTTQTQEPGPETQNG